jgi:hypothetical protein
MFRHSLAGLIVAFFVLGCASSGSKQMGQIPLKAEVHNIDGLTRIAVLEVSSPTFKEGVPEEIWKRYFEDTLQGAWRKETSFEVIPSSKLHELTPDASLYTQIGVARDRVGSQMGALQPAELAFQQRIVAKPSQEVLWSATFLFVDKALTDNLFDSHSGRWENLETLARVGFQRAATEAERAVQEHYRSK